MANRGHEVTVLTSAQGNEARVRSQNGVTVVEKRSLFTVSQARIAPGLVYAGLDLDFDIVHGHVGNPPAPFGALLYSIVRNIPLVISYHGDPQPGYGSHARMAFVRAYMGAPLGLLIRRADAVLLPSLEFLQDSQILGQLRKDYAELPNGVVPSLGDAPGKVDARRHLGLPCDEFLILYLGSLNPYKAPDILLEATAILNRRDSAFRVVFAGDGILRESLMKRAARMGLEGRVRFEGYVPASSKKIYFAAADVFVLTSTMAQEVFPVTILEAFGAGLPVVVSDLNTFRRFVRPGENGLVVKRGNPDALAAALLLLKQEESSRLRLAKGARASASEFSWERIATQAEVIYGRLSARKPRKTIVTP